MSHPDIREGGESTEEEDTPVVNQFWMEMMKRFGSEEEYNKQILASFSRADGVEVLIVIHKLLTGFDEPRNTVLYIDKPLKEHAILQAIARVNRLFPGKDFGYVIDYRGILGGLNKAMQTYDALAKYDPNDVDLTGAVIDTHEEIAKLPQAHTNLWTTFKEVRNKNDVEALEQHLAPDDRRQEFYDALTEFQKIISVALSTEHFYDDTPKDRIQKYKDDLKFFRGLRASVQQRYAEVVDYSLYEKQIRKVMDSHIQAPDVGVITELVNIFDVEAFDKEVDKREGKAAKADTIASRLKKTITEKMDEDPVFYEKFSDLVQQAMDDYRQNRIDEAEYLKRVQDYQETVRRGHEGDMPGSLEGHREAQAHYGILGEVLDDFEVPKGKDKKDFLAQLALDIENRIEPHKIRDWVHNQDVLKKIENELDDFLFELRDKYDLRLEVADMDVILERCLGVARKLAGA